MCQEEKLEVVKLYLLEGKKQAELAKMYDIDPATVSDFLRKFAAENDKSVLFMKKKDATTSESRVDKIQSRLKRLTT